MSRTLASIQRIISLSPIPEADVIEVAQVLGWKVVVKKGSFKVGDLVVYCEIDSVLPERPEFEFLRKNKFRIRTIRLKGQISQGICFKLEDVFHSGCIVRYMDGAPDVLDYDQTKRNLKIEPGADVTEILGITKYEAPIPAELAGEAKGAKPSFFPVTDEDRIQILPHITEQYGGQEFIVTEKLDGSSCSFFWRDGEFGVCGRNWEYFENEKNSMWKYARKHYLEEKLGDLGRNLALQGEIIGEGIQKNKYKLRGQTVKFFRVFDIDKYEFLPYEEMVELIVDKLKLETVPILDWKYVLPESAEEIIDYANGKSVLNPNTEREGVVFVKKIIENQGRLSFKSISNEFLIKNNE